MTFASVAFGLIVLWHAARRAIGRAGQRLPGIVSSAAWATIVLAVISLALPYRLAYQTKQRPVEWQNLRCYQIGEQGDRVLLFCPEGTQDGKPSRNRTAPKGGPKELGDNPESIFASFSPPGPGGTPR